MNTINLAERIAADHELSKAQAPEQVYAQSRRKHAPQNGLGPRFRVFGS